MEEPLTVDSFLDSLGLGRYSLAFKREEVSVTFYPCPKVSSLFINHQSSIINNKAPLILTTGGYDHNKADERK